MPSLIASHFASLRRDQRPEQRERLAVTRATERAERARDEYGVVDRERLLLDAALVQRTR